MAEFNWGIPGPTAYFSSTPQNLYHAGPSGIWRFLPGRNQWSPVYRGGPDFGYPAVSLRSYSPGGKPETLEQDVKLPSYREPAYFRGALVQGTAEGVFTKPEFPASSGPNPHRPRQVTHNRLWSPLGGAAPPGRWFHDVNGRVGRFSGGAPVPVQPFYVKPAEARKPGG